MQKTLELIEAAKARSGFTSDYRLAQVLEVHASTIVAYRKGRAHPSLPTVARLAELAGTDPDEAWLSVCMDRAATDFDRETWQRIGDKLKSLDKRPDLH